ncbi:MAG: HAMP domain-containing protein [Fibrobacterota bacterium]
MKVNIAPKLFIGFLIIILLNAFFVLIVSKLSDLNVIADILRRQNEAKNQLFHTGNVHFRQNQSLTIYRDLYKEESAANFIERGKTATNLIDTVIHQLSAAIKADSIVSKQPDQVSVLKPLLDTIQQKVKENNFIYNRAFKELYTYIESNAPPRNDPRLASLSSVLDSADHGLREGLATSDSLLDYQTRLRIQEIGKRIDNMSRLTIVIVTGLSVFSILFGLFFSRAITNSLRRLRESANEIARGDFDFDPSGFPKDEIGDLAQAFFDMSHDLKKAQAELIKSKRLAAIGEIVASVNHEINNPLMIISGNAQFLEMMMMEEYPVELQNRVKAILEETERISQVTRKLREIRNPVVEDYTSSGEQMINLDKSSHDS